eukprot:CAMPEP_0176492926 /NCGR_PEP_ID=MMETSP0200_2-20121128/9280_1 /TAXON_ID=947934 /ORGANISM="Chaetoceros sp., Strain GSL56" /LENGTH=67 /DNA_ID=CAMNT_0017890563 /DNA_START=78 /DNA_END=278 /DNA_ORIENTATION=+
MISQRHLLGLIYSTVLCLSGAQSYEPSYEEYADSYENQDNLYASYAMKQQQKEAGAGGPGFLKLAIA